MHGIETRERALLPIKLMRVPSTKNNVPRLCDSSLACTIVMGANAIHTSYRFVTQSLTGLLMDSQMGSFMNTTTTT